MKKAKKIIPVWEWLAELDSHSVYNSKVLKFDFQARTGGAEEAKKIAEHYANLVAQLEAQIFSQGNLYESAGEDFGEQERRTR